MIRRNPLNEATALLAFSASTTCLFSSLLVLRALFALLQLGLLFCVRPRGSQNADLVVAHRAAVVATGLAKIVRRRLHRSLNALSAAVISSPFTAWWVFGVNWTYVQESAARSVSTTVGFIKLLQGSATCIEDKMNKRQSAKRQDPHQ